MVVVKSLFYTDSENISFWLGYKVCDFEKDLCNVLLFVDGWTRRNGLTSMESPLSDHSGNNTGKEPQVCNHLVSASDVNVKRD